MAASIVALSAFVVFAWVSPEPIRLCLDPSVGAAENALRVAGLVWNHAICAEVFQVAPAPCDPDAARTVTLSPARIRPWIAITFPSDYPEPLAGDILLEPSALNHDFSQLVRILMHELGHVLGLGHSYEEGSIMWPWPGMETWITEVDRQAARERWFQ